MSSLPIFMPHFSFSSIILATCIYVTQIKCQNYNICLVSYFIEVVCSALSYRNVNICTC